MDASNAKPPTVFQAQLELWLNSNDYSDSTIKLYGIGATRWMKHARPWADGWQVRSIQWRKTLTNKAMKTQAAFVGAAKLFVNWLIEEKLLDGRNPLATVKFRGMSSDFTHRRSLTNAEVKMLFATCDLNTVGGIRDSAILKVMLYTALRIGAISGFEIEDIEDRGDIFFVKYQGKGQQSKARQKVLPLVVMKAIVVYLQKSGRALKDKGPLWTSATGKRLTVHGIRKSVVRKFVKCKIKDKAVTTHSLRHTAATRAMDSGNDIRAIQDLLDHGSIATTDRYIHSEQQMERAATLTIDYDLEDNDGRRGRPQKNRKGKGKTDGRKPSRADRKHSDKAAGAPAVKLHARAGDGLESRRPKRRGRSG